ncbi:MAG: sulfur globule family protein [Candidatus Sedimenticola sp. (ex Thyasira tokunagai)]
MMGWGDGNGSGNFGFNMSSSASGNGSGYGNNRYNGYNGYNGYGYGGAPLRLRCSWWLRWSCLVMVSYSQIWCLTS